MKNNKDDHAVLPGKKSTVVPVEQFKTFSVYEDHNENDELLQTQQLQVVTQKVVNIETTSQDVVDKENVYREKQQRLLQHHILTDRR